MRRQAAANDLLEIRRAAKRWTQRRRRAEHDLRVDLDEGATFIGYVSGKKLEQDDAKRPDVRTRVDLARRFHLFWRHVERRPQNGPALGVHRAPPWTVRSVPARSLHDSKVEDFHALGGARLAHHEQVGWLQVAVDETQRVRLGYDLANLQHEVGGLLRRKTAVSAQPLGHVVATEVLHDDVGKAGSHDDIEHAYDVIALDACRGTGFLHEAL